MDQFQSIRPFLGVIPLYPAIIKDQDTYANFTSVSSVGPQGPQGVSVTSAYVEPNPGHLILVLSDGTQIDAGYVIGPMGPQGPQGDPGTDPETSCNTVTVKENYESTSDDCYIGVNSSGPVTISLPVDISDGHQIAIKAQMGPPLGNRKVTIVTLDGSLIDGENSYTMTVPYESVHVLYHDGNWNIV